MTTERICAYYSADADYSARLTHLRRRHPEAHITAMIPPHYAISKQEREGVDEVIQTERDAYTPRDPRACMELIRRIWSGRYTRFVVMHDSAQLTLLAALSGARRPECWDGEGQIHELPRFPVDTLLRLVVRPLLGHIRLIGTAAVVYVGRAGVRGEVDRYKASEPARKRDLRSVLRRRRMGIRD